uniref:Uncharacterized protein n=1 Tax=Ditylenchus dipsaci TaxID=166011 RepID=A0A915DUG7_9BILA
MSPANRMSGAMSVVARVTMLINRRHEHLSTQSSEENVASLDNGLISPDLIGAISLLRITAASIGRIFTSLVKAPVTRPTDWRMNIRIQRANPVIDQINNQRVDWAPAKNDFGDKFSKNKSLNIEIFQGVRFIQRRLVLKIASEFR